ncbi:MAG: hypothetical protein M3Q58_02850, partial [Bacteroidota bacterium]|nr:hypothetical protein [Bacteroidota bacterium]
LKKARCFYELDDYPQAVNTLGRVSYYDLSDTLLTEVYYKSALYAYLGSDFTNAESQLLQLDFYVENIKLKQESLYLHILVLNELQKWDKAKNKLIELVENSEISEQEKTLQREMAEDIYHENNIPELKSIAKAQKLASFLPGIGHFYAGYYGEGIVNAGFQVVFLGLTAYGIYAKYYITALAMPFTFFQKFYTGAMPRLEYLVNKRNYEVSRLYNNKLKLVILEITEKNSSQ